MTETIQQAIELIGPQHVKTLMDNDIVLIHKNKYDKLVEIEQSAKRLIGLINSHRIEVINGYPIACGIKPEED